MIYIEKGEKVILPKRYHRMNNMCAVIYDQLTEIFVEKNYKGLTSLKVKADMKNQLSVKELKKGKIHILDWLKINSFDDELITVLTRHLTLSIVNDFVNFTYESLSCAKRGKIPVAYALLRKPFTDELLILEQLLSDPKEFINRFFHDGDPSNYDPSKTTNKQEIIKKAIEQLDNRMFFNDELIYEMRYDKSAPNGISAITNHALHIVTNDKRYKTKNQNLNFVFSASDDYRDYWDHYYYFVPYLLIYSVSIIDGIIFKYLTDEENENLKAVKSFRRIVGLILHSDMSDKSMKKNNSLMFNTLSKSIQFSCDKCSNRIKLTRADFEFFFESETFLCSKCFSNLLNSRKSVEPIKNIIASLAPNK